MKSEEELIRQRGREGWLWQMYCVGKEEGTKRKAVLLEQERQREHDTNEMQRWAGPRKRSPAGKGGWPLF